MSYHDSEAVYRSVLEAFAELADTYDARMAGAPTLLLESTETLSALPDLTDATVADFGCGTGRYTLQMARMGARSVTGMDAVPEMLAIAERKIRRADDGDELPLRWVRADLTEPLPMDPEMFDAALCSLTLSFLPAIETAFVEMARTLKPSGTLVVSDYHPYVLAAARASSIAAGRYDKAPYLRFTTAGGEECRVPQTVRTFSELFTAARAAGLTLDHIAEPVADRRLANTYAGIRDMVGVPLALILRFRRAAG